MSDFTPSTQGARPGFIAYQSAWSRTTLTRVEALDPRLQAVAKTIRATCNVSNGVQFLQFEIHPDPALSDYFDHNRIEADFFFHFFTHPDVRRAFPNMPQPSETMLGFHHESGTQLTERLERGIMDGGAYRSFRGSAADAAKLVADFGAGIGDRFSSAGGWVSEEPWNGWFRGMGWDRSLFWFDRGTRIATVLLTTDTD
ncbi:hypothetical protein TPR58_16430 [Sphingomonas sp. HF-S3]|uniref:Uncharacterized protein n=1 Tax=Sphingomonas rustica TaxID=3103142 RepID=A0ABV0BB13_9SPHN